MTETLEAPPLLRKTNWSRPSHLYNYKQKAWWFHEFCLWGSRAQGSEIFQADDETEKNQKTVNTKTGKQKLNRKPLLLLLLFLHLLCTIYKTFLARNFELKDRKKFRSSNNHKSFFSSSAPKHCNITKKNFSLY